MVYIFESMLHMSQEEKLEHVRQQLIDQIRDGVVLLPANMRLKEVVNTPMGMDILVNVETKKGGGKPNVIDSTTKNDGYINPQIENFVNNFGWEQ